MSLTENVDAITATPYSYNATAYQGPVSAPDTHSQYLNLKIYPNPAQDYVQLRGMYMDFCHIYSPDGKLLRSLSIQSNNARISTAGLAPGMYFLRIKNADKSFSKKLMVE